MVQQKHWRLAGYIILALIAFLVWNGTQWSALHKSLGWFLGYWGFVVVLVILALYLALIDIRYIRLQYLIAQREIFRETIGDEEFRKALREAQEAKSGNAEQNGKD
ncbi:MAG: hypothetical protein KJ052_16495 [Candidatus Hydrogenedentes bacterium]|nr:hypothetical protein [Candidatus Hydrogenedentota bacterium]